MVRYLGPRLCSINQTGRKRRVCALHKVTIISGKNQVQIDLTMFDQTTEELGWPYKDFLGMHKWIQLAEHLTEYEQDEA